MGRGDKKTKKGKQCIGSYGNSRLHKPQHHAKADANMLRTSSEEESSQQEADSDKSDKVEE